MSHCRKANVRVKPIDASISYGRARTIKEIDELEASLNELEIRVTQMDASLLTLNRRFLELTEMRYVLREAATFFDEVCALSCSYFYLLYVNQKRLNRVGTLQFHMKNKGYLSDVIQIWNHRHLPVNKLS